MKTLQRLLVNAFCFAFIFYILTLEDSNWSRFVSTLIFVGWGYRNGGFIYPPEYTDSLSFALRRSLLITLPIIGLSLDLLIFGSSNYWVKVTCFFILYVFFFIKRFIILRNLPIYENPDIQHINRRTTHSTWKR